MLAARQLLIQWPRLVIGGFGLEALALYLGLGVVCVSLELSVFSWGWSSISLLVAWVYYFCYFLLVFLCASSDLLLQVELRNLH